MSDKPGYEFAVSKGYSLHSYSGADKNGLIHSADYVKDDLFLTVRSDGTGKLTKILGMVTCTIADFSIPNKNFESFEKQMRRIFMV